MKKNNILFLLIMFSIVGGLSCNKTLKEPGNGIYINGINTTTSVQFPVIFGEKPTKELNISTTSVVNNYVSVSLKVSPELVENYNNQYETQYLPLPDTCYKLSANNVNIKPGANLSNNVNLEMVSFASLKRGVTYVLPVSISQATGARVIESLRTIYYLVTVASKAVVPAFKNNYFKINLSSETTKKLSSLSAATVQLNVKVNSFATTGPRISALVTYNNGRGSIMRFGDAGILPNQLQVLKFIGDRMTVGPTFNTGQWYNIAYVYDNGDVKVYVNGAIVATAVGVAAPVDLSQNLRLGQEWDNSRSLDGMMSEFRIWSKALTQEEIISGTCEIDPSSEGLELYLKLNEGEGSNANDATGKGSVGIANATVQWITNETCQ